MTRFRMYFNKDKACAWLNEMAAKGWRVVRFGGGVWEFEPCGPGQYAYRMDFSARFGIVGADYRSLMGDLGLDIVNVWGPWVLLEAPGGADVPPLYTDSESQEAHTRRMLCFFKVVALVMLVVCMAMAIVCADERGQVDTAALALGWCAVVLSGVMALVFLGQVTRLREQIRQILAGRGEAPGPKKRLPVLMLAGMLIQYSGLLAREALEPWHGIFLAIEVTGVSLWCVGIFRLMRRNGA